MPLYRSKSSVPLAGTLAPTPICRNSCRSTSLLPERLPRQKVVRNNRPRARRGRRGRERGDNNHVTYSGLAESAKRILAMDSAEKVFWLSSLTAHKTIVLLEQCNALLARYTRCIPQQTWRCEPTMHCIVLKPCLNKLVT